MSLSRRLFFGSVLGVGAAASVPRESSDGGYGVTMVRGWKHEQPMRILSGGMDITCLTAKADLCACPDPLMSNAVVRAVDAQGSFSGQSVIVRGVVGEPIDCYPDSTPAQRLAAWQALVEQHGGRFPADTTILGAQNKTYALVDTNPQLVRIVVDGKAVAEAAISRGPDMTRWRAL